ncbi:ABC transporter ATP-binding protein [Dactylosporangium sp. NPDC051541]|uniref:ABC transporter ATP-binding protein n=1 Tax=Dactylosporangium sp. NPDC051541 TaxID=3363977 RepID=UPI0037BB7F67
MKPAVLLRWCLRDARRGVAASWIGGLAYQGGLILLPWCLGRALDDGITGGDRPALLRWAAMTFAVSAALTGAEFAMRWWAALAGVRTGNALLLRLAGRVLGWDTAAANRFSAGDLVTRGTRDVETITVWIATVPSLVSGVLGFIAVIVVVATLGPALAAIGLATVPLLIAVNLWYPRRYERANSALSAAHSDRADAVEDLLSASTAVRGLGGEAELVRRHHAASDTVRERTLALARVAAAWAAHAPFVPWLATAAGVGVGGLLVLDGRFSIGGLVAFASWMTLLGRQVMMLTFRFGQLGDAWTAAGRIGAVLDTGVEHAAMTGHVTAGDLRAEGLVVERPGRAPLRLPDLTIHSGEFVAIVGGVGTGKTTLLRLLAGLEEPDAGGVTYGGTDLREAGRDERGAAITFVGQRPLLLSGTIAGNLRLGRDGLSDDDLRAACRTAAIDTFIAEQPDGLATEVGERGSSVSGGQLQRLALARGLLRGAGVLLLDDVTSAVDATTEQRILQGLRALGRTVVIATSRPAVAEQADRVLDLGPARTGVEPANTEELVHHG